MPVNYSSLSYIVLALSSATYLSNTTSIFHDFPGPTIEFHDFPGLENEMLKFHDFPGFPRRVRTLEVQDRDGEMKAKAKLYADKKRHVEYSDLVPGDRVLLKQEKQNKLSTPFAPEPYDVVSRNGSSIVIKSPEGVQLKRNTAHVKKYEEPLPMPSQTVPLPVEKGVQAKSPTLPTILRRMVERKGMLSQRDQP